MKDGEKRQEEAIDRMIEYDEFAAHMQRFIGGRRPLLPETDLVNDLGIAGRDGDELLDELAKVYGLKFTDEEFAEHFGDEVGMPPWNLVLWLIGRLEPMKPLTMADLYRKVIAADPETR